MRGGLAAPWLDAQLILQLAQLSNSIKIHTNHNLVCLKKSSRSGLGLHLSTAWDEIRSLDFKVILQKVLHQYSSLFFCYNYCMILQSKLATKKSVLDQLQRQQECPNKVCLENIPRYLASSSSIVHKTPVLRNLTIIIIFYFVLFVTETIFLSSGLFSVPQLAQRNTPIHPWNISNLPEGFSLSIKRDDLTGSTLSGNKVKSCNTHSLTYLTCDKKCC